MLGYDKAILNANKTYAIGRIQKNGCTIVPSSFAALIRSKADLRYSMGLTKRMLAKSIVILSEAWVLRAGGQ